MVACLPSLPFLCSYVVFGPKRADHSLVLPCCFAACSRRFTQTTKASFRLPLLKTTLLWHQTSLHYSRYVGRAFKDAARRAAGGGTDDFLGHAVFELSRIPRGGLFMHRLHMLKRSKKSHVDGCIEITANFSLAEGAESHYPLVSDQRRYGELVHRIVLCEAPLSRNEAGMWDCSISKWANTLLQHGVLAAGLSPCQTLSYELDSLTFCNKVPEACKASASTVNLHQFAHPRLHKHTRSRACTCTHTSPHTRAPTHNLRTTQTEPGHSRCVGRKGHQHALSTAQCCVQRYALARRFGCSHGSCYEPARRAC